MSLVQELMQIKPQKDALLSIGVFDGVHLGHKHLISGLQKSALSKGYLSGIVTFDRHPEEIVSPQNDLCYLTTLEHRKTLLHSLNTNFVVVLPFTEETASITALQFVILLQKHLRMKGLVIGPNFTLGKNREGNIANLKNLGKKMGFTIEIVPPLIINKVMSSSTNIRDALHNGDIPIANRLLGRHFSLKGQVVTGVGQSTTIGFPTANINIPPQQCLPDTGVYVTLVHVNERIYTSLTNIGGFSTLGRTIAHAPVQENNEQFVEVHLLDFTGNLKGTTITIEFLERLREELHFDNIDALRLQIETDIAQAKAIFAKSLP